MYSFCLHMGQTLLGQTLLKMFSLSDSNSILWISFKSTSYTDFIMETRIVCSWMLVVRKH